MIPQNWKQWLKSLIAAVIGGAANSLSAAVVDPAHFNLSGGLHNLAEMAAAGAFISLIMFLKQSPVPPDAGPSK